MPKASSKVGPAPTAKSETGDIDSKYYPAYRAVVRQKDAAKRFMAIKAAGVPLAAKRSIRNAVQYTVDDSFRAGSCKIRCIRCQASCHEGLLKFQIWRNSFKQLEGMYGTGVLSYFVFLKSLFILNIIITLLVGLFIVTPQAINSGYYDNLVTQLLSSSSTNQSGVCTQNYVNNVTSTINSGSGLDKFLDVIQGTGILENTILFVGNYFPIQVAVGTVAYSMPVAYFAVIGVVFFVSFLFMLNRTGAAFKEAILQQSGVASEKFSLLAFTGWDYGLMDEANVKLARRILRNTIVSELDLFNLLEAQKNASLAGKCCLWLKRILVNLLVLALLGGSGYLIYYVQVISADYTSKTSQSSATVVYLIYQFLPSIVIALLAGLLPIVFGLLVKLEEYTPDTALLIVLLRSIFLRLASVAVLIATIYSIVTCSDKDECMSGINSCSPVRCWESYVGQAFYKLQIVFFFVCLLVCFAVELPRSLIARKCTCGLAKLIGQPEFDIANSVLEVLYAQVIVWFGAIFCPFLPLMNTVTLFILFYLKKFACYFSYKPQERPFKSSKATTFFMVTLFLAYFMCVLPLGYMMTNLPVSRGCSPFRLNNAMYDTVTSLIDSFGTEAQLLFRYLGSAGFLFFVIMVLLIVAYYYRTLAVARKEISAIRRKDLRDHEQQKFANLRSAGKHEEI